MTDSKPSRAVAIIGGATAGAEVAARLANRGIQTVVFEQNKRPFGKIEDGLPRWHHALRQKEYDAIRAKLSLPLVEFVPETRVGEDIPFEDIVENWGFASVVLANGAWWDRPLPIDGAEAYVNKGLFYQNPFVIAFNHAHDENWSGDTPEVQDGSIVIGGGLASIDVAKIVTLTCTQRKLAERGIDVDLNALEVKGIPKTLAAHDLSWEDLGLEGATIYYRRRVEDMPLVEIPYDADEDRIAKLKKSRKTILEKATKKFMFKVEPLSAPDDMLIEDGRLVGLRFRRTKVEDGRVVSTDETFERRTPAVISSIGSIPEPISGIGMKGELFDFSDREFGRLESYPTVFSVGNVVTGKGNIVASRKHAQRVCENAIEVYLGVEEDGSSREDVELAPSEEVAQAAEKVGAHADAQAMLTEAEYQALMNRVAEQQKKSGYPGDLEAWMKAAGEPC